MTHPSIPIGPRAEHGRALASLGRASRDVLGWSNEILEAAEISMGLYVQDPAAEADPDNTASMEAVQAVLAAYDALAAAHDLTERAQIQHDRKSAERLAGDARGAALTELQDAGDDAHAAEQRQRRAIVYGRAAGISIRDCAACLRLSPDTVQRWHKEEQQRLATEAERASAARTAEQLLDDGCTLTVTYWPGVSGAVGEDGHVTVDPEPAGYIAEAHRDGALIARGDGQSPADAMRWMLPPDTSTYSDEAPF